MILSAHALRQFWSEKTRSDRQYSSTSKFGSKSFFERRKFTLLFFKSRGYYIYSVERDLKCIEDLAPLSIKEQQSNMECANSNQLLFDDFMPQLFDE